MRIGGFQKFSLLDYPAKISAVVFTQGCNFRCPYCHNPELVDPEQFGEPIAESYILDFLKRRLGKLDAVVITGGEPTVQPDLIRFIQRVKKLGYLIKLDTNGSNPLVLREIIVRKVVDYLAMDIKAPSDKYHLVTGTVVDIDDISRSIELIKESGIDYEFRSTLVKKLTSLEEVIKIGNFIGNAKRYYLQTFVATKTLNNEFEKALPFSKDKMQMLTKKLGSKINEILIR